MVGDWPLGTMASGAAVIVIGRVVRVAPGELGDPPGPLRIAEAEVLRVLKGRPAERVRFVAEPTWACDISFGTVPGRLFSRAGGPPSVSFPPDGS